MWRIVILTATVGFNLLRIKEISKESFPQFLEKALISRVRPSKSLQNYQNEGEPHVYKSINFTPLGFGYFYFCNRSKSAFSTTISFQNMNGVKLKKPFSNQEAFSIRLDPGEEKIVLTKLDPSVKVKQAFIEAPAFQKNDDDDYDYVLQAKQHGIRKQRIDTHSNQLLDIWFYLYQYDNGILVIYENKTTDRILEENIKFELEGLEIREEKKANQMKVIVKPGETKIIYLDKTAEEFSASYTVSYITKLILPINSPSEIKELVSVIKQKGDKKIRKDLIKDQEVDIYLYLCQHGQWTNPSSRR